MTFKTQLRNMRSRANLRVFYCHLQTSSDEKAIRQIVHIMDEYWITDSDS